MIWSDTPPSEPGWYWVRGDASGEIWPTRLHDDGSWECTLTMVQFGQRIPSAEELVELQCKADELDRIHAVWGLKRTDSPDGGTMPNASKDTNLGA
jgi:hypothetical protein